MNLQIQDKHIIDQCEHPEKATLTTRCYTFQVVSHNN